MPPPPGCFHFINISLAGSKAELSIRGVELLSYRANEIDIGQTISRNRFLPALISKLIKISLNDLFSLETKDFYKARYGGTCLYLALRK